LIDITGGATLGNANAATAATGVATFDGTTGTDHSFNINANTSALNIGDYILISSEEWQDLNDTGTNLGNMQWIIKFNAI